MSSNIMTHKRSTVSLKGALHSLSRLPRRALVRVRTGPIISGDFAVEMLLTLI